MYYQRFIIFFPKITKPFTKCLKKGGRIICITEFCEDCELRKNLLSNEPIIQYPDFDKPLN